MNTAYHPRRQRRHFFASPEDLHWGHVTALADHAALLKRIIDAIYAEGEHAQPDATGM